MHWITWCDLSRISVTKFVSSSILLNEELRSLSWRVVGGAPAFTRP